MGYGTGFNHEDKVKAAESQERSDVSPLFRSMMRTFENCLSTARRKNADYSGNYGNEFANFEDAKKQFEFNRMGISMSAVEDNLFSEIRKKVVRVGNLLWKESQVNNESIEDSLDDLINYAALLKAWRELYRYPASGIPVGNFAIEETVKDTMRAKQPR